MDNGIAYFDLDDIRAVICEHYSHDPKKDRCIYPDSQVIPVEIEIPSSEKIDALDLIDCIIDASEILVEGRLINGIEVTAVKDLSDSALTIKTYIWVQAH